MTVEAIGVAVARQETAISMNERLVWQWFLLQFCPWFNLIFNSIRSGRIVRMTVMTRNDIGNVQEIVKWTEVHRTKKMAAMVKIVGKRNEKRIEAVNDAKTDMMIASDMAGNETTNCIFVFN